MAKQDVAALRQNGQVHWPFIPSENIARIEQAISFMYEHADPRKQRALTMLQRMNDQVSTLDILLTDARSFLNGSQFAGRRFLAVLESAFACPPGGSAKASGADLSFAEAMRPISQPGFPGGDANGHAAPDLPGNNGFPSRPFPWQRRADCLFPPENFLDIYFGIYRLQAVEPQLSLDELKSFEGSLRVMVERSLPLGILFSTAADVINGEPVAKPYFNAALRSFENQADGDIPGSSLPLPPGLERRRLHFDLCRILDEQVAEASRCAQAALMAERFTIESVINQSEGRSGMSRMGCGGDLIEIVGTHFGDVQGRITFGLSESEAEITSWSNTAIRFVVPENIHDEEFNLFVPLHIQDCTGFDRASRLPEPGTDFSFEVLFPPRIVNFYFLDPAVQVADSVFRAEACTPLQLYLEVNNTETVQILDPTGSPVPFEESPDDSGVLRVDVLPDPDTDEPQTYTVDAENLCTLGGEPISEAVAIQVYKAVHVRAPDYLVRARTSIGFTVRLSCPAPTDGLAVMLNSSRPDAIPAPSDPVYFAEGESVQTVYLTASSLCLETTITGRAVGHETGQGATVMVYDTPVIRDLLPIDAVGCRPFELIITGDCLTPYPGGHAVELRPEMSMDGSPRYLAMVEDEDGEDPRRIVATVPALPAGQYEVRVLTVGGYSDPYPLRIYPSHPEIIDFRVTHLACTPQGDTEFEVTWEVRNARQIQIFFDQPIPGAFPFSPSNACESTWSDTQQFYIPTTVTDTVTITLTALPFGTRDIEEQERFKVEWPYPLTVEPRRCPVLDG